MEAVFCEEALKDNRVPGVVQDKSGNRAEMWRELWLIGDMDGHGDVVTQLFELA